MNSPAPPSCPFCRAPVPEGEAQRCDACGTIHHQDCWRENEGCTITGCPNAPARSGVPTAIPAAGSSPLPPIAASPEPAKVDVSTATPTSRGLSPLLVGLIALGIVALAGVGVAAALVFTGGPTKVEVAPVAESPPATTAEEIGEPAGTAPTGTDSGSTGPPTAAELSLTQVERGATRVLVAHHEALKKANGDPSSEQVDKAYRMLSKRKRAAEEAESSTQSGRDFWIAKRDSENLRIGQAVCLPGTVELAKKSDWDAQEGVAFVYVDFGTYRGSTWVKYESGEWTYDAGFGHVPERTERWRDAPDVETLFSPVGGSCGG